MPKKYLSEYRNRKVSKALLEKIKSLSRQDVRLMEVCGTHTVSIFKSGIRGMLPDTLSLLSGPGCPVCVTTQKEIDAFIELSGLDGVILATFGDLIRVPGSNSSLQMEQANGRDIRIVYSTLDALEIAKKNPDRKVIFPGVGFETTAPTIAASLLSAQKMKLDNYFVYSAHKLIPPALEALMGNEDVRIDGFILPGHVSVIIGEKAYLPVVEKYRIPCAIAGFEPVDILQAVLSLVSQIDRGCSKLVNTYKRAVSFTGNDIAQRILDDVFEARDASWRGIGTIPASGLKIRETFESFDAEKMFHVDVAEVGNPKGCKCGQVLLGLISPPDCPLYKKACTPLSPVGPCMVSSEGTCAAYYRYHQV